MSIIEEFKHLQIQLEAIKSATDSFDRGNIIGSGGFGIVYKGQLLRTEGHTMAAFKRLDRARGQGDPEFWKEILMLSQYTHENLISLLGFCHEDEEKILVYEYVSNGSLDQRLSDINLSWTQRLRICVGAARGLNYLHDPKGSQQRVLHRDIKSSNILLDDNDNAKLSDLGLSRIGPANQQYTMLVSYAVGTPGYCDPMYMEMGFLTKESDVYSFGVVLFEIMCGRLCVEYSNGERRILVPLWVQSYEEKKLDEIVWHHLWEQILDIKSLNTFSAIAYRCLQKDRQLRPMMVEVLEELEIALELQEYHEDNKPMDYQEIMKTTTSPVSYTSTEELHLLLSKGLFVHGGKTWLQINNKGENCVLIPSTECLIQPKERSSTTFVARVRTKLLSPHIIYAIYLVFKDPNAQHKQEKMIYRPIKYRLEKETKLCISYIAEKREDGCFMVELYQFTSFKRSISLEIMFKDEGVLFSNIVGIEFQPIENVMHEVVVGEDNTDMQPISDSDTYWEQKLPSNYKDIINRSDNVRYTSMKELYFLLHKGILINKAKPKTGLFSAILTSVFSKKFRGMWFFLDENEKNCLMLPASVVLKYLDHHLRRKSDQLSRFNETVSLDDEYGLSIHAKIEAEMLSPDLKYGCYLVYKLPEDHSMFEVPMYDLSKNIIYLVSPQTPVIRLMDDQSSHNPLNRPKLGSRPQLRKDGWMEVQFQKVHLTFLNWYFQQLHTSDVSKSLNGLQVQGIELRPI